MTKTRENLTSSTCRSAFEKREVKLRRLQEEFDKFKNPVVEEDIRMGLYKIPVIQVNLCYLTYSASEQYGDDDEYNFDQSGDTLCTNHSFGCSVNTIHRAEQLICRELGHSLNNQLNHAEFNGVDSTAVEELVQEAVGNIAALYYGEFERCDECGVVSDDLRATTLLGINVDICADCCEPEPEPEPEPEDVPEDDDL